MRGRSLYNSASQVDAPTRAEPALSMKQLKAIALTAKWASIR
ncbi:hypothetical protein [Streptomyces sp. ISL-98]|nr:hypothetical protein [Streptomyces sp. ISL-98]